MSTWKRKAAALAVLSLGVSGCGFSPYDLPLPGGADLGDDPYEVTVEFRDVLDLVPQSAVRVNDIAVGKVTDIELNGWTALVTLQVNSDAELPDNAEATIRQTSLLGEKFVALSPPAEGATGTLSEGDKIPLSQSGRNPEIEEVLGAASLLFNGGGLEKTNTIVRELSNALGGNEPEVKQLIKNTTTFLGELDDNKQALIGALEKVNRLAVETNNQEDAITGALDDLPEALQVVNDQRDDLVKLLQSLNNLGDVATQVVADSKDDTVRSLKKFRPILRNLALAGDDLAKSFEAILTFPFSDGYVGGSVAKATGQCTNDTSTNTGPCLGDYGNLSLRLNISATQLENLLGGFDLTGLIPSEGASASNAKPDLPLVTDLVDLVEGLVPQDLPGTENLPGLNIPGLGGQPTPNSQSTPAPSSTATPGLPSVCSLLGLCRPAAGGDDSNFAQLLTQPVVAP